MFGKSRLKRKIDDLEELGYFKYSSFDDINELKNEMFDSIRRYKEIGTIYFENSYEDPFKEFISKDHRFILCDHEELIETHGEFVLKIIAYSFEKMNLPFEWKSITKDFDEKKNLHFHKFTINSEIYILYQTNWSEYAIDFAIIVNDQLEKLNSQERLYLIATGNDGDFIFLDRTQMRL